MALGQEEIGRRIRQARDDAGLTQQDLSERVGVRTAQTVSRWERGEAEVSTKRLRKIAEVTGKPLGFFVQEPEVMPPLEDVAERVARLEQTAVRIEEKLDEIARRLEDGDSQA